MNKLGGYITKLMTTIVEEEQEQGIDEYLDSIEKLTKWINNQKD